MKNDKIKLYLISNNKYFRFFTTAEVLKIFTKRSYTLLNLNWLNYSKEIKNSITYVCMFLKKQILKKTYRNSWRIRTYNNSLVRPNNNNLSLIEKNLNYSTIIYSILKFIEILFHDVLNCNEKLKKNLYLIICS